MDLNEFYKQVEGIVVFPGSVQDLNQLEFSRKSGKTYSIVPLEGNKTFITGILVPSREEIKEILRVTSAAVESFAEVNNFEAKSELEEELESQIEPMLIRAIGNPAMINLDLRLKAKKLGADGIVHVQMYSENFYFGVPVKNVNASQKAVATLA